MKTVITTSWDDGHPIDLKLAKLLTKYNLNGTFYIAPKNRERTSISIENIKRLSDMGMEIGGHTLSHPILSSISSEIVYAEIVGGKKYLEEIVQKKITSFCYPRGAYNEKIVQMVKRAGYKLARTTAGFCTDPGNDSFHLPTTLHLYPHSRSVILRHNLKLLNLRGLLNWGTVCNFDTDLVKLTQKMLLYAQEKGGIFHLWGHSWEIEKLHLWNTLEKVLKLIAHRKDAIYVSNGEIVQYI